jgi:hypothetical protein
VMPDNYVGQARKLLVIKKLLQHLALAFDR